jgi:hypothetical protein
MAEYFDWVEEGMVKEDGIDRRESECEKKHGW